ncbi:hypothetical protein AB4Z38_24045 [Arthrobacter sp. 2RAF6]|uniref:hypothetical protein n=1 Tax=Arthrobacter sp. 2RAF6 TaxID=3233002 RepID=UPI003F8EEDBC
MNIKDEWDRLDSETRTWLLENPACLLLPPAMSAKFCKDRRGDIELDPNGQVVLSRGDHDFIREKAEGAGTIRAPMGEYRFFDTAPLTVVRKGRPGMSAAPSPDAAQ